MLKTYLKSKIHRAMCTRADVDYEGSIEIPQDLMDAAGLEAGEKVLVTSATAGGRLETYVQAGIAHSKEIILNGGAAHIIKEGERITIMSFALAEKKFTPTKIVCNADNTIARIAHNIDRPTS